MKTYIQFSKTRWIKETRDFIDELLIDDSESGSSELIVRWYKFNKLEKPSAKIELFEDGWNWLSKIKLLKILSKLEGINPQPEDIIKILEKNGFKENKKYNK